MKKLPKYLVKFYQVTLSPGAGFIPQIFGVQKAVCPFYPTCSMYASEAYEKHGLFKGALLSTWRILRCYPFRPRAVDPVPEKFSFKKNVR